MSTLELTLLTNDPKVVDACKRYWEHDAELHFLITVEELGRNLGISKRDVLALVTTHCRAEATDKQCDCCGTPYVFTSRTEYIQHARRQAHARSTPRPWRCAACQLANQQAQQAHEAEKQKRHQDQLREAASMPADVVLDPVMLSLNHAVYLLSLVRLAASEDLTIIGPAQAWPSLLAPTSSTTFMILSELYEEGLIAVHPDSPLTAFTFEDDQATHFNVSKVWWTPRVAANVEQYQQVVNALEMLLRNPVAWPSTWLSARVPLWKQVAVDECLAYLHLVLTEHGLPFQPGEKTHSMLNRVLEHFSIGQVYKFIWSAVRDAAAFYQRTQTTRQHAANTVPGAIQRAAERAIAENWQVKPFSRNYKCPESMLTHMLFTVVLQIGEAGWTSVPQEEALPVPE